jgi:protein-disulfide isomerase
MHARLFAHQRALSPTDLPGHAAALNLDGPKFQACLDSGRYAPRVRKDLADGQQAGVTGTPAFFLGLTQPNAPTVKLLRVLKGAQPYAAFKEAIDGLLSSPQ